MSEDRTPIARILEHRILWDKAPLPQVQAELSELKRAYDKILARVMARTAKPKEFKCWVWDHKKDGYDNGPIPKRIVDECRKTIEDGKWLFRDDSNKETRDGIEILVPVVCCSVRCHDMYIRYRNDRKARDIGAHTATENEIELR